MVKLSYEEYVGKNGSNTIFIFQLMISITTYKIFGFITLFPWFASKSQ